MKLHIHGGLLGAAQYGLDAEITLEQALLDGYRIWIDPDGWYVGDPTARCRWSGWKASPIEERSTPAARPRLIPNPECASGKHNNCDRTAWDTVIDSVVECPCDCHEPKGQNA